MDIFKCTPHPPYQHETTISDGILQFFSLVSNIKLYSREEGGIVWNSVQGNFQSAYHLPSLGGTQDEWSSPRRDSEK